VKREMTPGQAVHITPKTVHRMTAIEDSDIYEVSTPELHDVVRWKTATAHDVTTVGPLVRLPGWFVGSGRRQKSRYSAELASAITACECTSLRRFANRIASSVWLGF